ncbi:helix-turn-helix domain-containing protein [Limosilactobacillus reuteri]|uniref:helix-turn-helix domain-containing protein n=1 Tax=Limosilactobacillus reuteri TaxID=1598 RepID=UPI001E2DCEEF|nr:helix-turn-helix transcriptional regulator [Limosilactobacillus reuteri]MCC4422705.1 helix-turn-helix domain-containing protein [Limosilactobacillus reuteri]
MKFGDRIKEQRIKLEMTQANVAQELFTTRQTISNWEKGKSYPDLDTLIKISDLYHVPIDSLLREDKDLKNNLDRKITNKKFTPLSNFISFGISFWFILQPYIITNNLWARLGNLGLAISMLGIIITAGHFSAYIEDSPLIRKINSFVKKKFLRKSIVISVIILALIIFTLYPISASLSNKTDLYFGFFILILAIINVILEFANWILDRLLEKR